MDPDHGVRLRERFCAAAYLDTARAAGLVKRVAAGSTVTAKLDAAEQRTLAQLLDRLLD